MASSAADEDEDRSENQVSEPSTEEVKDGDESPSHLPLAPSSELFDVPTTVDPSYIISLIRRILPSGNTVDNSLGIKFEEENMNRHLDASEEHRPVADTWEEYGCILWDLSVEKDRATFMVENLLLDVLLANLSVSNCSRITEICLGIIGNLACHENLTTILISKEGLVETVVDHLFEDDSICLMEICRLLTVSLRGSGSACWVKILQPEHILERILWIAENTLNSQLLEKNIELLLTVIDNQEVAPVLLPSLSKLGLPMLLHNLLECEMNKLLDENKTDRISIIDLILQAIESLSTIDGYSHVLSSNEDLFRILCRIVKLPDKIEVTVLCPTAVVIIANILTDETHFTIEVSRDMHFLKGLLDIFPLVSTDLQARNALWSILARLLSHVQDDYNSECQEQVPIVFIINSSHLIEEDLDGHLDQGSEEAPECRDAAGGNLNLAVPALRRIATLLNHWISDTPSSSGANDDMLEKAGKLLGYCLKYGT